MFQGPKIVYIFRIPERCTKIWNSYFCQEDLILESILPLEQWPAWISQHWCSTSFISCTSMRIYAVRSSVRLKVMNSLLQPPPLWIDLGEKNNQSLETKWRTDVGDWTNNRKLELGGGLEMCSCNGCTWECQLCVILENTALNRLSQPFQNRKLFFLFSYFKSVIWSLTSCNCIILFLLAFLRRQKGNGNLSEVSSLTTLWSVNGLLLPFWPHCVCPCLDSIWNFGTLISRSLD